MARLQGIFQVSRCVLISAASPLGKKWHWGNVYWVPVGYVSIQCLFTVPHGGEGGGRGIDCSSFIPLGLRASPSYLMMSRWKDHESVGASVDGVGDSTPADTAADQGWSGQMADCVSHRRIDGDDRCHSELGMCVTGCTDAWTSSKSFWIPAYLIDHLIDHC